MQEIKDRFKKQYEGTQGIYMVRLDAFNNIAVHVEDDSDLDLPSEYEGTPVRVIVAPMMKTF